MANNKADELCSFKNGAEKQNSDRSGKDRSDNTANVKICLRATGKPTALLRFYGSLYYSTVKLLRNACDVCIAKNINNIIVDMSNVAEIDSAGWGYFVAESNRLKNLDGTFMLTAMKPETHNIFTMLGIDKNVKAEKKIEDCQKIIDDNTSVTNDLYKTKVLFVQDNNNSIVKVDEPNKAAKADVSEEIPLYERIYSIIHKFGPCSFFEIKKLLNSDEYGNLSISVKDLYGILKELNLDNMKKRLRFYRSC